MAKRLAIISTTILAFVEQHHPPADLTVYKSSDHGQSWAAQQIELKPDGKDNVSSMHMNAPELN